MTKEPNENRSILNFERETSVKKPRSVRGRALISIASAAFAVGAVLAANSIFIPEIEFGAGVASLPACVKEASVDFDLRIASTGTSIRALDIKGLVSDCNGEYLRITLTDSNGQSLRQLQSGMLSTSTTLRITVPDPAINPASVFGFSLDTSDSPF